jgi:hypothetical protein
MEERVKIQGGPGNRPENAWIIQGSTSGPDAAPIKREVITSLLGPFVSDWTPITQNRFRSGGRVYDELIIETPDGQRRSIFFDVTDQNCVAPMTAA